jgi:hypothetical protein
VAKAQQGLAAEREAAEARSQAVRIASTAIKPAVEQGMVDLAELQQSQKALERSLQRHFASKQALVHVVMSIYECASLPAL